MHFLTGMGVTPARCLGELDRVSVAAACPGVDGLADAGVDEDDAAFLTYISFHVRPSHSSLPLARRR